MVDFSDASQYESYIRGEILYLYLHDHNDENDSFYNDDTITTFNVNEIHDMVNVIESETISTVSEIINIDSQISTLNK